eukprot:scaffold302384_cov25-Prasinocladus_malaysianus.AAC.1
MGIQGCPNEDEIIGVLRVVCVNFASCQFSYELSLSVAFVYEFAFVLFILAFAFRLTGVVSAPFAC